MSGTRRSLSALYALLADNSSGNITAQHVRDLAASTFLLNSIETSFTGTATATLDAMHVCSGTSVDYTVTLPTAVGNAGRMMAFRMSNALTRLVTLDGNASETIDGEATRIMWAGESAVLISDGSQWLKISGRTIPMHARIQASSSQSVAAASFVLLTLGTVAFDIGSLTGTANTITIRRAGNYVAMVGATLIGVTASNTIIHSLYRNGSEFRRVFRGSSDNGNAGGGCNSITVPLSAGDAMRFATYGFVGTITTSYGLTNDIAFLSLQEVPSW